MYHQRQPSSKEHTSPTISKPVSGTEAGEMNKNILLNKQVRESNTNDTSSNWSTMSVCGSNSETSPTASISGTSGSIARKGSVMDVDGDGDEYDASGMSGHSQEGHDGLRDKVKQRLINSAKYR